MAFQEKQLGQLRPANTTAASLYSPGADTTAIGRTLTVANVSSALATYQIFVDDDGTTYDETTATHWNIELLAGEMHQIDAFLAMNNSAGNIAVRTSVASAINFTLFGVEIT